MSKHAAGRYSSPPGAFSLEESTRRLAAPNDALALKVGGLPMPAAVAVAALDLTDESRLAVMRELTQRIRESSRSADQVVAAYEREARARLGGRGGV